MRTCLNSLSKCIRDEWDHRAYQVSCRFLSFHSILFYFVDFSLFALWICLLCSVPAWTGDNWSRSRSVCLRRCRRRLLSLWMKLILFGNFFCFSRPTMCSQCIMCLLHWTAKVLATKSILSYFDRISLKFAWPINKQKVSASTRRTFSAYNLIQRMAIFPSICSASSLPKWKAANEMPRAGGLIWQNVKWLRWSF